MSPREYTTDHYINFIKQERYDKVSPIGLQVLAEEINTLRAENERLEKDVERYRNSNQELRREAAKYYRE